MAKKPLSPPTAEISQEIEDTFNDMSVKDDYREERREMAEAICLALVKTPYDSDNLNTDTFAQLQHALNIYEQSPCPSTAVHVAKLLSKFFKEANIYKKEHDEAVSYGEKQFPTDAKSDDSQDYMNPHDKLLALHKPPDTSQPATTKQLILWQQHAQEELARDPTDSFHQDDLNLISFVRKLRGLKALKGAKHIDNNKLDYLELEAHYSSCGFSDYKRIQLINEIRTKGNRPRRKPI
jgi:hypothetical protein